MSIEAVQAFRSLLTGDVDLQKACVRAVASGRTQEVVDAAAARGLSFTAAELEAVVADGELSDTELELVAGGGDATTLSKPQSMGHG